MTKVLSGRGAVGMYVITYVSPRWRQWTAMKIHRYVYMNVVAHLDRGGVLLMYFGTPFDCDWSKVLNTLQVEYQ